MKGSRQPNNKGQMFALTHFIKARLRQFTDDRRQAQRYKARREVLVVSVALIESELAATGEGEKFLAGHTRDISETGLAILLRTIRMGSRDLREKDVLRVVLALPRKIVILHTVVTRISMQNQRNLEEGYLIGVHIRDIGTEERTAYLEYLRSLQ